MNAVEIDFDRLAQVKELASGGFGHSANCTCATCQNKRPAADRLLSKIAVTPAGCWEWTGKIAADGYGVIRIDGKDRRVHRVSFDTFVRSLADSDVVCHRCDNPPCLNPDHLFAGSRSDNNRDMATKGRARNRNSGKLVCDHGHAFTPENTITTGKGERQCRECHRQKLRGYRASKRAS